MGEDGETNPVVQLEQGKPGHQAQLPRSGNNSFGVLVSTESVGEGRISGPQWNRLRFRTKI